MSLLAIDIETYSDVDLQKCGVYAYSDSPNFEILLFAYAFDDEDTQIVDMACGEQLPQRVLDALEDESIVKTAFNAALNGRVFPNTWDTAFLLHHGSVPPFSLLCWHSRFRWTVLVRC